MKELKNYDCAHRYLGECQDCIKDRKNLDCPRYYPILVSLGEAIIPNREIKDDLVRMLKEHSV
jgi:hypothetical protein